MRTTRILPVLALTLLLGGALTACDPAPASSDDASATAPATSTPTTEASASGTPEPEPEPALDAADRANIRDAVTSGNSAALEGYFSDPVRVIYMASECCWDVTPAEAVGAMSRLDGVPGPWDFDLPAATIDVWASNQYYGYLFTGDDISGLAADGTVVNFGIVGDRITTVLLGFEEGFTH